jgi:hypothetical protein
MRLHCAEVLSLAPTPRVQSESVASPDGAGRPTSVKALFIDVRVEGFFLERFDGRGELLATTQHDTMDEAMWQAYSEFVIADWRSCPEDVDPVEYIRTQSEDSPRTA